ncbi:MAG: membrane protein insertion efficiency factor YidD [Kofleriaceae bacterium]
MRALVVLAIRGYRRWLSGRGPLARVRCTFASGASCSAYGLRAARTAPTVGAALGQIRRRLRRCRDASVYAVDSGGRHALGWGALHDVPLAEVEASLGADGEDAADRATVLAARALVARWRGDALALVEVTAARRGLPAARPQVRRVPTWRDVARGLVPSTAALASVVAVLAHLAPVVAPLAAAAAVGLVLARLRVAYRQRARLRRQARADQLRGALPVLHAP